MTSRSQPGAVSPDARGKDETRARILVAARDCFSRFGFERTTVKMIAAECGLTDAAIYYYFPSKRHVMEALWNVRTNRGIRGMPTSTPLTGERLRNLNDAVMDFLADNHQMMRLMVRSALDGDEVARALRDDNRASWRVALHEHFRTVANEEEATLATELVMGYITGATMRAHMEMGEEFQNQARSSTFRAELHTGVMELLDLPLATQTA